MTVATLPSHQLYAQARAALVTRRIAGEAVGWHVGVEVDLLARLDAAMAKARAAVSDTLRLPVDTARQLLFDSARELRDLAAESVRAGISTVADSALILADRASLAAAKLGAGAGEAWRSFWGLSPAGGLGGLLLVGLLVATGGGYLLLTPGGQAALAGAGKALGPVLAKGLL